MKPDELREFLRERGVQFDEREIQSGRQFRCNDGGEIFAAYDSGRVVCQGKRTDLSKAVNEWKPGKATTAQRKPQPVSAAKANQPVFIVYGHDTTSRDALELVVRRMGLEPIVLANLPTSGDTVIEKLEHYLKEHGILRYRFDRTSSHQSFREGLPILLSHSGSYPLLNARACAFGKYIGKS